MQKFGNRTENYEDLCIYGLNMKYKQKSADLDLI